jgi:bifunctional non-homologous end joining protein LigD
MLARSGRLPLAGEYAYELKWDGFRALVSTVGRLRVLSRQWWEMTPHLPELAGLPRGLALDGELIAFGDDGKPSFPRLCQRMLQGHEDVPIMLIAFDVLHGNGSSTLRLPYRERRALLESLDLHGEQWGTCVSETDGEALWRAVCVLGLEGIVAKKQSGTYRPGGRDWIKIKNRDYWRYPLEVEAMRQRHQRSAAAR